MYGSAKEAVGFVPVIHDSGRCEMKYSREVSCFVVCRATLVLVTMAVQIV